MTPSAIAGGILMPFFFWLVLYAGKVAMAQDVERVRLKEMRHSD